MIKDASRHLTREETIALADQSLAEDQEYRARAHLQTCTTCQQALAAEEGFQNQLAQAMNNHLDQVQAPASMRFAPIKRRMESSRRRTRTAWLVGAAAAALVLLTSLSLWSPHQPSQEAPLANLSETQKQTPSLVSGPPPGWHVSGNGAQHYDVGTAHGVAHQGRSSSYLQGRAGEVSASSFVTLMQTMDASSYHDQKIRFSAWMRLQGVKQRAGLWMKVSRGQQVLSFDNMESRPLRGDTGWVHHSIVLDVPASAETISFGMLLTEAGMVYVDDLSIEQAPADTPVTGGVHPLSGPTNLDFEQ